MKRRSIFAMLATTLTAAAQTFKGEPPEPDWRQCADPKDYPLSCGKKLARNNQCPVCGTMAEPFHPAMCTTPAPIEQHRYNPDGTISGWYREVPCQTERITRCHRCDAAFWQDAEEKRK